MQRFKEETGDYNVTVSTCINCLYILYPKDMYLKVKKTMHLQNNNITNFSENENTSI